MQIILINPKNPDQKIIKKTVQILKSGGVVIYPTDTCYGLGVDFENPEALKKLYKIKRRETRKPVSVIMKDLKIIKKYCRVDDREERYLKKYLPGPFTFILRKKNRGTLGVRIPDYKITRTIANQLNRPFTATSANLSGKLNSYNFSEIKKNLLSSKTAPKNIDLILEAGKLSRKLPSTVVDLSKGQPEILRQGTGKF